MSWLSQGLDELKTFVTGLEGKNPGLSAPVEQVRQQVAAAAPALEALGTQLVNTAVDAVLGLVPGGAAFETLADGFIDDVIASLAAKKSATAPAPTGGAIAAG